MVIDFHTHTFPDKIAAQTIKLLSEKGNTKPYREGTLNSLKESMNKSGVDYSVVFPVATTPHQVESINRLSAEENGKDGIFFAGAIHPDCENIEEILDFIKANGLFGIKIHPDYQGVYFDDERYIRIMREAAKRNLITVTHAGIDIGYPDDVHCTPQMVLNVLDRLSGLLKKSLFSLIWADATCPTRCSKSLSESPFILTHLMCLTVTPKNARRLFESTALIKSFLQLIPRGATRKSL